MGFLKKLMNITRKCKRKKKIAFHAFLGTNYGSVLQSYALFKTITKLGYHCEIIGASAFIDKLLPDKSKLDTHSKEYDKQLARYNFAKFLRKNFPFDNSLPIIPDKFVHKIIQTIKIHKYGAFVCGSDQIWYPGSFWFRSDRYLQFVPPEKRIAYAPSLGRKKVEFGLIKNIPQWREMLCGVKYLSARESTGASTISRLTGRDVTTVLDPTFLLTPEEWKTAFSKPVIADNPANVLSSCKKYVLAYLLDLYEEKKEFISAFAKKYNLEIVWLAGRDDTGPIQINATDTDPAGFVELVKKSSFIFCDGFHGCCFSLIFSKPFAFFLNPDTWDNDCRISDLFDRLGVKDRIILPDAFIDDINPSMEYSRINKKINHFRDESLLYLASALKEASDDKSKSWLVINEYHLVKMVTKLHNRLKKIEKRLKVINTWRKNRIPLDDPDMCTGCAACANICPTKAISMKTGQFGFSYPEVDFEKCIECGKCYKLCPLRKKPQLFPRKRAKFALAAWSKDPRITQFSASGGMFPVLANWAFSRGGTAYGAAYDAALNIRLIRAERMEEIVPIMGSKYVQGETGSIFSLVRKDLNDGKAVVFSGTSCQIGGLYAYLGSDHANLLTVDLVCTGVPSPLVFHKYLQWREKQFGKKIINVQFRSKSNGWGGWLRFDFADGSQSEYPLYNDEYGILFGAHFIQRPSCFVCHYRGIDNRWADVTIGDFWGIGEHGIPFNEPTRQGVSLVLANSEKAETILATLMKQQSDIFMEQRPLEECFPGNAWLLRNYEKSRWHDPIMKSICEIGFEAAFEKYFGDCNIRLKRNI